MKTVICANSFEWLPANRDQGSILTSLPDASEIGITDLEEYDKWVRRVREDFRGLLEASSVFSAERSSISAQNWGAQPTVEDLEN